MFTQEDYNKPYRWSILEITSFEDEYLSFENEWHQKHDEACFVAWYSESFWCALCCGVRNLFGRDSTCAFASAHLESAAHVVSATCSVVFKSVSGGLQSLSSFTYLSITLHLLLACYSFFTVQLFKKWFGIVYKFSFCRRFNCH